MDFQKILENKPLLYGIIGGIVILLAVFVTIGAVVAKITMVVKVQHVRLVKKSLKNLLNFFLQII